ncbi:hypothetical protein SETIT_9G058200v2 [Setaria italica]|uniref:Uncharacterized protein n=1 Tax=Setaria italica TaxID=4555 RepID=A0A368SDJ0_SETIT|nr:hypothetical protein SETIT_9G058200v2 [Setaria italica]
MSRGGRRWTGRAARVMGEQPKAGINVQIFGSRRIIAIQISPPSGAPSRIAGGHRRRGRQARRLPPRPHLRDNNWFRVMAAQGLHQLRWSRGGRQDASIEMPEDADGEGIAPTASAAQGGDRKGGDVGIIQRLRSCSCAAIPSTVLAASRSPPRPRSREGGDEWMTTWRGTRREEGRRVDLS